MRKPRSQHSPGLLPDGSLDRLAELREEFDLTVSKLKETANQEQRRALRDWLRAIVREAACHLAKSEQEVYRMQRKFRSLGEPCGHKRLMKPASQNHNANVASRKDAA